MDLTMITPIQALIAQTLTIIVTLIGAVFTFYWLTRNEITVIREDMRRMDDIHREDVQRMDAKWERLFERLLIQDQQRGR